ncbi:MAG: DMT family transporter, partial [Roseibium sp.]|uniref:DMT family transporter n=1 Tax=Roseibium sp. TaxID=1936156 RepID=UPI00263960F1
MAVSAEARPQYIAYGVTLIVVAALTISVQDVVFKFFSSSLPLWQIFALRGFLALPMLLGVCWAQGQRIRVVHEAFGMWSLLRAICITLTFLAFYAAIPFLSLSTVGSANYVAPVFVTLLSAYTIRETVGRSGWLGVFLGFLGVVVLLQPGTDTFSVWSLLPITGAAFYALAHIITRTRCQHVPLTALSLSL